MYLCAQNHDLKRGGTFETAKAGTFHSVTAGTSIPLFTTKCMKLVQRYGDFGLIPRIWADSYRSCCDR